jgi:transcriptional regulator with XRE-family HTH domain
VEVDVLINDLVELGELIRRRRIELQLSQSELAEMVSTTRQWVSRLEKGKNDIGTARLLAVFRALELNLDVRPPRVASVDQKRSTGQSSLLPSEAVQALAQMNAHLHATDSLLPSKFLSGSLPDLNSVLARLTAPADAGELAVGRRHLAAESQKLSQRTAEELDPAPMPDHPTQKAARDAQP